MKVGADVEDDIRRAPDRPRGDRARPDAGGRRQPALGRRRRRSTWMARAGAVRPVLDRGADQPRRHPRATRRSPGPSRRSGSRPASTSTTGSCSSSSSRPAPSASARSTPAAWAASTRSWRCCCWRPKFGVPVCPHAGGVGLCELVQHLAAFDYVAVSGTLDGPDDRVRRPPARAFRRSGRRPRRALSCCRRRRATAPRCRPASLAPLPLTADGPRTWA